MDSLESKKTAEHCVSSTAKLDKIGKFLNDMTRLPNAMPILPRKLSLWISRPSVQLITIVFRKPSNLHQNWIKYPNSIAFNMESYKTSRTIHYVFILLLTISQMSQFETTFLQMTLTFIFLITILIFFNFGLQKEIKRDNNWINSNQLTVKRVAK